MKLRSIGQNSLSLVSRLDVQEAFNLFLRLRWFSTLKDSKPWSSSMLPSHSSCDPNSRDESAEMCVTDQTRFSLPSLYHRSLTDHSDRLWRLQTQILHRRPTSQSRHHHFRGWFRPLLVSLAVTKICPQITSRTMTGVVKEAHIASFVARPLLGRCNNASEQRVQHFVKRGAARASCICQVDLTRDDSSRNM